MRKKTITQVWFWVILLCVSSIFLTAGPIPQENEIELIRIAIKEKGAQWTPKESNISRLGNEQFIRMLGDRSREVIVYENQKLRALESYPQSIDWRNINGKGYVTKIKDQGECGSPLDEALDVLLFVPVSADVARAGQRPGRSVDAGLEPPRTDIVRERLHFWKVPIRINIALGIVRLALESRIG